MKAQCRIYFDLDLTLYDTIAFMADISRRLRKLGSPQEKIDEGFALLEDTGYSFEEHMRFLGLPEPVIMQESAQLQRLLARGSRYLLPGISPGLTRLRKRGYEFALLTFGYPPFQQAKWDGLPGLSRRFVQTDYVWQSKSKGDVLSEYRELPFVFCDDSPRHLLDARRKIRGSVCLIRFMWPQFDLPPHPEDGRMWQVVTSFDEFASAF